MKNKINLTFSIPSNVSEELHAYVKRLEMSPFLCTYSESQQVLFHL